MDKKPDSPQPAGADPGAPANDSRAGELWPEPPSDGSSTRDLRSDFSQWLKGRGGGSSRRSTATVAGSESEAGGESLPPVPTAVEEIYEDLGEIGHGGMGSVHRVYDRRLLREAALKILRQEVGVRHREARRFIEEAQITGQLDHPNIVPIHELGQDARGVHYFTMKLVQGKTLEQTIDEAGEGRLEPETLAELLGIFIKVCDAIAFAHSRGVVHRDLKPSNIMVGEFGQVYVMDWGIARLLHGAAPAAAVGGDNGGGPAQATRRRVCVERTGASELDSPGTIVGTPRYMAPDQVQGDHERTDHRADVFALGGTLYHILTGHAPYTEENYFSLLVKVQNCELKAPRSLSGCERCPSELDRITMKAMAPEPEDRYASVLELQHDIERFLRGVWHLPTEVFAAGEAIVREGDEGDAAYIIRRGRCRVLKRQGDAEVELRRMGPGEVFGETAIFAASRRSASVVAVDEVEVTVVTSDILSRGLGLSSWMGTFVKALANRFRELDARLHAGEGERHG